MAINSSSPGDIHRCVTELRLEKRQSCLRDHDTVHTCLCACVCRVRELYELHLTGFEDLNRQNRTGLSPYVIQKSIEKATGALMSVPESPPPEDGLPLSAVFGPRGATPKATPAPWGKAVKSPRHRDSGAPAAAIGNGGGARKRGKPSPSATSPSLRVGRSVEPGGSAVPAAAFWGSATERRSTGSESKQKRGKPSPRLGLPPAASAAPSPILALRDAWAATTVDHTHIVCIDGLFVEELPAPPQLSFPHTSPSRGAADVPSPARALTLSAAAPVAPAGTA